MSLPEKVIKPSRWTIQAGQCFFEAIIEKWKSIDVSYHNDVEDDGENDDNLGDEMLIEKRKL